MDITILTSITGGKDNVREDQCNKVGKFVAYTDTWQTDKSDIWTFKPAPDVFVDPRRNSRIPKILPHQYVDTEYSIWLDGNIALKVPANYLVDWYLKDYDFAVFGHPTRGCLYDEALVCAQRGLDAPEKIIEQVTAYEKREFAKNKGLGECGVLIRRHTKKMEEFNNYWWSEYCRHSRRDQISFPYVVDKLGMRVNWIQGHVSTHEAFDYKRHEKYEEPIKPKA
jgi:hypothetical protein